MCVPASRQEGAATGGVQAVGVGDESQAPWAVHGVPPQSGGIDVVVDGHAHPGELGQVVDGTARGAEVEVQKPDRDSILEDDVLEADVVVANDRTAGGVCQLATPGPARRIEGRRCAVEPDQERCCGRQGTVGAGPRRVRRHGDITLDEHQPFPAVIVDPDGQRGSLEPGGTKPQQERVDRLRERARRSEHVRTDSHHPTRVRDATDEFLLHDASIVRSAPDCREGEPPSFAGAATGFR